MLLICTLPGSHSRVQFMMFFVLVIWRTCFQQYELGLEGLKPDLTIRGE